MLGWSVGVLIGSEFLEFLNLTVIKEDHTLRKLTWIVLTLDLVVIVVVIIAMTLALSACTTTTQPPPAINAPTTTITSYTNINPGRTQATWDHDHYQCRRENTHEPANPLGRPYIDEISVWLCLRAKGWRKV